ncbi:MAG: hypothetical protein IJN66_09255 [Muribaculaceae bacterium]|nr:hypothetical protein [Muribaculaceae bacterium]
MSIFGKVKQALGFSDVDDYFDTIEDDNSAVSYGNQNQSDVKMPQETINKENNEFENKLPLEIFDSVIKIFNDSLPEFIKSSLDIDAQRQYIYNSLNQGMKDYLEKIVAEARQRGELKWKEEKSKLQSEISQLKVQNKNVDEQRSEWQKQQLSAERQKRAMSERLHDLEKQVATLEAEKEQYDLENKSLLNKLKVSSVLDGDIEVMRQQIIDLQTQLKDAQAQQTENDLQAIIDATNHSIQEKDNEIALLKEQLMAFENSGTNNVVNSEDIDELNRKIEELTSQNSTLEDAIQQLKAKEAVADAMINDLNSKASEAVKKLEEREREISTLANDKNNSSEELDSLKEKLTLANQELQAAREELEEAHSSMQVLDEIQEQISLFEDVKKKKDSRISELQEEVKMHLKTITDLEKETASLKKTIENNLYRQIESEKQLRKELENLKSQKAINLMPISDLDEDETVAAIEIKNKKKVKISAIDESLDDTDWLVSTPPPGTVTRPTPATTDEDFGYQSPSRKQTPDNDAQMSLF